MGERVVARCEQLGRPPYSEQPDGVTRRFLTPAHRQTLDLLASWMLEAGMSVRLDPMGTLVGRYEASYPGASALLFGSHVDSVPNGGRYDGPLGVMLGVECIDHLHVRGVRLPFAVEVAAFGDEEGSRFPTSMLGSRAITGRITPDDLDIADESGVRLADALSEFGLDVAAASHAARRPGDIFAFVEPHIEQGPLLEVEDSPVGIVTGIAAQLRLRARFDGIAGHAGTTPMRLRTDALAGVAEAILAVERICGSGSDDLVGTVGKVQSSTQAFNVISGEAEIGIDIRAATMAHRDSAAEEVRSALEGIAARRGLGLELKTVQDLPGCSCDPTLMGLLDECIKRVGLIPRRLMSGAGHDAMTMSALAPVAMLFIRCEGGVSHNPAERVQPSDVALAARVLVEFIKTLGARF